MSIEEPEANWVALHVSYDGPDARHAVVAACLAALGRRACWYFADVPVHCDAGARPGLEIGLRGGGDFSAPVRASDALEGVARSWPGVKLLARAREPQVLQPWLFPWERMPPWYPTGFSIGSIRAAYLLGREPRLGEGPPVSAAVVRQEVVTLVRALLPHATWRRFTMEWYAQWLEATVGNACTPPLSGRSAEEHTMAPTTALPGRTRVRLPSYRQIRDPWGIARPRGRTDPAGDEPRIVPEAVAAIVARLAHVQAVRLWGQHATRRAPEEIALARALASSGARVGYPGVPSPPHRAPGSLGEQCWGSPSTGMDDVRGAVHTPP